MLSHARASWVWLALAMIVAATAIPSLRESGLLAIVVIVVGVAIAWRDAVIGVALLAASIPMQDVAPLAIGGVSLTWTRLALLALIIGWCLRGRWLHARIDMVTWGHVAILVALTVSVLANPAIGGWAEELYRWLAAAVAYVVARDVVRSDRDRVVVLGGVAAGVVGVSLAAIVQVVQQDGPPSYIVNGVLRAYGTFGAPNPFAAYLEMSLFVLVAMMPLIWSLAVARIRTIALAVTGGAISLGGVSLLLTQSRGGWLGCAAGAVVLWLAMSRTIRWRLGAIGAIVLVAVLVSPFGSRVEDRLGSIAEPSGPIEVTSATWANEERRAHWGAALAMMEDHPWTGVGAGAFDDRYREYTPVWRFRIGRGHAHNGFLQMGAQAGIPGLAAFACWIIAMIGTLVRARSFVNDPRQRFIMAGGIATVIAFVVHSLVDYLNVLSLGIQLSVVLAVSLASLRTSHETPSRLTR